MNTRSEIDISGLRCYDKTVDDVTYHVPRGITREARGRVWIVRVLKNKRVQVYARFTDLRFDGHRLALEAAIIHLLHSGYGWRRDDVLQLGEHTHVHWRKRSGVGLCAVAYVSRQGPGRGETFFLSTYRRVASGRGLEKFRSRLIAVLESAYDLHNERVGISYPVQKRIRQDVETLWQSDSFQAFMEAGKRKVDEMAVADYVQRIKHTCDTLP